ncbi:MAG: hypothetical protein WBI53_11210 [Paludibacter sp.]
MTEQTPNTGKPDWNNYDYSGYSAFEEYDLRGRDQVLPLLQKHGWSIEREGEKEQTHLVRNGSEKGILYSDKTFMVKSSTEQFKENAGYKPSDVFAKLECGGDYKEAEIQLKKQGFGLKEKLKKKVIPELEFVDDIPIYLGKDGKIDAFLLSKFLEENNFVRISIPGVDQLNIYHIDKKALKVFNKTDTVCFLTSKLKGSKNEGVISNFIYKERQAIKDIFQLIPGVDYDLQRDTESEVYLSFRNGVAKVTKAGAEMLDFENEELKYFAEVESQKHDFKIPDFPNRTVGNFEKFILYAIIGKVATYDELTKAEERDVKAFYSMIGYLISNYKNPTQTPAIIFSDLFADGVNRIGRRGKTILTRGINIFKYAMKRGGLEFDPTYRHVFSTLTEIIKLVIIDDVKAGFNYDGLYTQISGDITSEKKGINAVEISFKDAPKFVITTNWVVRYDKTADSTNDRFKEYKFSHFWNIGNKPVDFFNERFFITWNDDDWQLFFEFMISCVIIFLTDGLQEITYSKEDDNFNAYFSNDVILEEFGRILEKMNELLNDNDFFTTTNFLDVHYEKFNFNKSFFDKNNVKNYISCYSDKYKLGIKQNNRRQWVRSDVGGENQKMKMPF